VGESAGSSDTGFGDKIVAAQHEALGAWTHRLGGFATAWWRFR
jgi:hypothetical protein